MDRHGQRVLAVMVYEDTPNDVLASYQVLEQLIGILGSHVIYSRCPYRFLASIQMISPRLSS